MIKYNFRAQNGNGRNVQISSQKTMRTLLDYKLKRRAPERTFKFNDHGFICTEKHLESLQLRPAGTLDNFGNFELYLLEKATYRRKLDFEMKPSAVCGTEIERTISQNVKTDIIIENTRLYCLSTVILA